MTKPSEKAPSMENALNGMTQRLFGRNRTGSIKRDICVTCGGEAKEFKDELSRKEYTISGMCQKCQNSVFGG